MPLSEHEQRLLDQMEQSLYHEDPKFVSRLAEDPIQARTRKRMLIGGGVLVLGLAVVVLGVASQLVWLGGIGFAVMVAGGGYALTPSERRGSLGTVTDDGSVQPHKSSRGPGFGRRRGGASKAGTQGSFMERMEARWERRRGEGGW